MISSTHLKRLQFLVVERMFFAGENPQIRVSLSDIELDGRKQKTLIRDLAEYNYVLNTKIPDDKIIAVTPNVFADIKEEAPDLNQIWNHYRKNHSYYSRTNLRAVSWHSDHLTPQNKKYLIAHKDQFTFLMGQQGSSGKDLFKFVPNDPELHFKKVQEKEIPNYNNLLMFVVTCDSLIAYAKDVARKEALEAAKKQNLSWGLKALGIVEEGTEDFLEADDTPSLFNTSGKVRLSVEPENWDSDLGKAVDSTIKRLSQLNDRLKNLYALQTAMRKYGGWDKFIQDYHKLLETELDKEETANV